MTIDLHATCPATTEHHEEIVQFVFRSALPSGLLTSARTMLEAAPRELAESFEQALRTAGFAS
jgi:hypothetical protein